MLLAVFVIGLVLFLRTERRVASPFMELELFKDRLFTGATASNFMVNMAIGTLLVALGGWCRPGGPGSVRCRRAC